MCTSNRGVQCTLYSIHYTRYCITFTGHSVNIITVSADTQYPISDFTNNSIGYKICGVEIPNDIMFLLGAGEEAEKGQLLYSDIPEISLLL